MIRTQVQIGESQYKELKALAHRRSKSISLLVREAVEKILNEAEREQGWQKLQAAVGTCHDREAAANVSQDHDEFLSGIYAHE